MGYVVNSLTKKCLIGQWNKEPAQNQLDDKDYGLDSRGKAAKNGLPYLKMDFSRQQIRLLELHPEQNQGTYKRFPLRRVGSFPSVYRSRIRAGKLHRYSASQT